MAVETFTREELTAYIAARFPPARTRRIGEPDLGVALRRVVDSIPSIAQSELGAVIPEVFGAVGDGVTDDTAAFVAACAAADLIDGKVELTNGRTYSMTAPALLGNLRLRGGRVLLTGPIMLPDGATTLEVEGTTFIGSGISHLAGDPLTKVRLINTNVSGGTGYHLTMGASDAIVAFCKFKDLHAVTGSVQAVKIGNNTWAKAEASEGITIHSCIVDGVTNDSAGETHAFLVYSHHGPKVFGNWIRGVYHAAESACEAIYFKAVGGSISDNTIIDCGPSEDGCISAKGTSIGDTSAPNGDGVSITKNNISYRKNITTRVIGITIHADKSSANDNTLINCCIAVLNKSDGMVGVNNITIAADGYTPAAIDVDGTTNLAVTTNRIRIVSTNLNLGTILAVRVRAAAAAVVGFEFSGNTGVVEYNGVTTGGTGATAFLDLFADQAALDAIVANNNFTVKAPSIGAADRISAIFFHGASTIRAKLKGNIADTDDFAAAELYKNSASSATITEDDNLEAA